MGLYDLKNKFLKNEIDKPEYIKKMHDCHKHLFEYAAFIADTDIGKIEISNNKVVMTTRRDGIKLICDMNDHRIIPVEIINLGEYESDDIYVFKKIIKEYIIPHEKLSMLDVGANIGWFSLNVGKDVRDGRICSFEPVPKTYGYLTENVKLNNLNNIETFNFGFSNENKEIDFYYYKEGSGNASLSNVSDNSEVEVVKSSVRTLDSFVSEEKMKVNIIKCDVEGAELFVFQGGVETLKRDKPIVFTEMLRKWAKKFNYHPNDIIDFFSGMGYGCYVVKDYKLISFDRVNDDTLETNYFFINKEKYNNIIG